MSEYVYDLAKRHHSVRKFKQTPIERATIEKLIEAGQMASTSSFLQTTSFIGVESIEKKEALREVSGQPYVVENGYLLVYVIDYHRHQLVNEKSKADMVASFESAEGLLVGTVDAALAAQNIALTAEDMGYGIVYLGSLRNDVQRVREILNLPEHVFPLFGMAIGEPADDEMVHLNRAFHYRMSFMWIRTIKMTLNCLNKLKRMTKRFLNIIKNVHKVNVMKRGLNKLLAL